MEGGDKQQLRVADDLPHLFECLANRPVYKLDGRESRGQHLGRSPGHGSGPKLSAQALWASKALCLPM